MGELEQMAVQTFSIVPEKYQEFFRDSGADFPDELVAQIKQDPNQAIELLSNDKKLLQAVVEIYKDNQEEINQYTEQAASQPEIFRKGGKLAYGLKKFQWGGKTANNIPTREQLMEAGARKKAQGILPYNKPISGESYYNPDLTWRGEKLPPNGVIDDLIDRSYRPNSLPIVDPYELLRRRDNVRQSPFLQRIPQTYPLKKNPTKFQGGGKNGEVQRGTEPAYSIGTRPTSAADEYLNYTNVWDNGTISYARNYFDNNTLYQDLVRSGWNGTPRRVSRIIYNYGMPKADTVYVDANGERGRRNQTAWQRFWGIPVTHSKQFMDGIDSALTDMIPAEINEKEVKSRKK